MATWLNNTLPWYDLPYAYQGSGHSFHKLLITLVISFLLLYFVGYDKSYNDDLPVVNRLFTREPHFCSRFRWAIRARSILDSAHHKFRDKPYRLARGDTDVVVLPSHYIQELNRLPVEVISSRQWHALTILGHLSGIDIVRRTSYHVKILLSRISPALPDLLVPTAQRLCGSIERVFPQSTDGTWTKIDPLDTIVRCVSEGLALVLYGPPTCDDPEIPYLVWLLPAKWHLEKGWKIIENRILPLVERQMREAETGNPTNPDVVSWMVKDGRSTLQRDPWSLTRLVGTLTAGGTYSTANFVVETLADLVSDPDLLEEIREEIREKHKETGGIWSQEAFNNLDKLESAMKESSRLAPSSLLLYGRVVGSDYTLSDGLRLKKGQTIAVCSHLKANDPTLFKDPDMYKGRRFYDADLAAHRAQPFRSVDSSLLTWGSGRWACPGRFFANMAAKVILVKLIDEFEFKFVGSRRPPNATMHEFILFHPFGRLAVRRRADGLGISF
ncbi:cytochrome P450 [Hypoxylon sp. EC38]|nr:cytochrome P450 [Hypoxylon sp. EC38]